MRKTDPKYRRLKRKRGWSDLAFVELSGRRVYLGEYGTSESRKRYHRLLAEWDANGRRLDVDSEEILVVELAARYLSHAQEYYRAPDGSEGKVPKRTNRGDPPDPLLTRSWRSPRRSRSGS